LTEDAQRTVPPNPDFLKAAAPWADTLSKSVAGIAIALYACGFLVVSLYHAKFGFVGTNPNKAVRSELIDESDEGFYIVEPSELKAIFLPRGAIAMIYFGDKPADSPMLQKLQ